MRRGAGRRFWCCTGLAVASVLGVQQAWVSASNFHGADEWLGIELASRGVVGVPYANRPLVFLWLAAAQRAWPDDLAAYWAFTSLAFLATGLLTAWLAIRILPRAPMLALLAGVFTVAWAPLDWLRLDTTLITGYAGFTAATLLALALFVESWRRQSRALLLCSGAVGLSCAMGGEILIPVLAAGPLLVLSTPWREATAGRARLVSWLSTWSGFVVLCALFAAAPALAGLPSYQTGALRLDLAPQRVLSRLVRLLGMQALPLVTSAPRELAQPAVPLAVLGLALGVALAWRAVPRASRRARGRDAVVALGVGLALASAAHLGLALTASVRDPGRSQLLSAPGFGLCLAASVTWAGTALGTVRSLTWSVVSKSTSWLTSTSIDVGRSAGRALRWMVSRRWMSVPPSLSTAGEVPTSTSGRSTVRSSPIFTTWKSTWIGLRLRGSSAIDWTSTGRGSALPTVMSRSVLRVTSWRRRISHASASIWMFSDGWPAPKMTAGRTPARRRAPTCLPVTVRGSAARLGRVLTGW